MRIAMIENEEEYSRLFKHMLENELDNRRVSNYAIDVFSNAEPFFAQWLSHTYDVILLDIYLEDMTGIEIAHAIREEDQDVDLVFCTTSNDFAAESYAVGASYYLKKPLTEESVHLMMNALKYFKAEENKVIAFSDGYRCRLNRIMYTTYGNHVVTLHLQGRHKHSLYMAQRNAEELLTANPSFVSVNRGTIVNLNYVNQIRGNDVCMVGGIVLPVSRSRRNEVIERYSDLLLQTSQE